MEYPLPFNMAIGCVVLKFWVPNMVADDWPLLLERLEALGERAILLGHDEDDKSFDLAVPIQNLDTIDVTISGLCFGCTWHPELDQSWTLQQLQLFLNSFLNLMNEPGIAANDLDPCSGVVRICDGPALNESRNDRPLRKKRHNKLN